MRNERIAKNHPENKAENAAQNEDKLLVVPPLKPDPLIYDDVLRLGRDADILLEHWRYARSDSDSLIDDCLSSRPSAALRRKKEDSIEKSVHDPANSNNKSDELIAWAVTRTDYAIGMLETEAPYRGRGCAKRIVSRLTNDIIRWGKQHYKPSSLSSPSSTWPASLPLRPTCNIEEGNTSSEKVFGGLGFKRAIDAHWLVIVVSLAEQTGTKSAENYD